MDSEGTDKFFTINFINFWNNYTNNIYPYKHNLEKVKYLFLFDNASHAI